MSDVAPPSTATWWDVETVVDGALAVLRLTDDDVDADRIRALVPVVGQQINNRLDADVAVIPDAVLDQAMIDGVVSVYRVKDSPPAAVDDFGLSAGYAPADPLQPVWSYLAPYRRRWGVA